MRSSFRNGLMLLGELIRRITGFVAPEVAYCLRSLEDFSYL
jgi:hypothetical protein